MAKAVAKTETTKPFTKTEIIGNIAEVTGIAKKDVAAVLDSLGEQIKASFGKKGPGAFVLPGLIKIDKKTVKAQPAKKNVPNPLRPGEFINKPAKPACQKVRVRALKALKEMV